MCLNIKEGKYPPPAPASDRVGAGMVTYVRECYGQPYYMLLFVGMTLAAVSFGPVNAFSVFYAKSVGMSMDSYGKYLSLTYAISLVLSYFLGVLADRFHPLRTSIVAAVLYAGAMFWGGFAADTPAAFAVFFVLHGVLAGVYATVSASLGQRLFPRAKFAQFASAGGILTAVAFFVTPALVGGILDASGHAYRITFWAAGILATGAVFVLLSVEARFRKLGGLTGYCPPESGG
jgi:MFS family permease